MDEHLQKMRRDVEANPADLDLAQRYEAALERAGETAQRVERYRFKFLCPLSYEDLAETDDVKIRACSKCHKTVHQVASAAELKREVTAKRCVAFKRSDLGPVFLDLADDAGVHAAQEAETACVVGSDYGWIDLDTASLSGAALSTTALSDVLHINTAERHHVCPVREGSDGGLLVASHKPTALLQKLLADETSRPVELVRAWPQAIERALDRLYPYRSEMMLMGDIQPIDPDETGIGFA